MRWMFFLLCLISCQKSSSGTSTSSQSQSKDLALFPDFSSLDGTKFAFTNLKASAKKLGPVNLMQIDLMGDPLADFYQFTVCMQDGSSCVLDKNTPGEFVYSPLVYPYAPTGNLVLSVRACLRNYNAVSPDKACTGWQSVEYVQAENADSPALKYAKQLYDIQVDIVKKAEQIYFLYQNQLASTSDPTTLNEIKNMLHMGQDTLGQLILSDTFLNSYVAAAGGNAQTGLFLAGNNNKLNPHTGIKTVNNITIAATGLSQPTEFQNQLLQQVFPNGPALPPSSRGIVAVGQLLIKTLDADQKKELNGKLQKIEMYQNLTKYLGAENPAEKEARIAAAQALHDEGKLSDAGLRQAKAEPLGSREDLLNVIRENPDVVIGKAQVHVEILDGAARGLVGPDLLNWKAYQKFHGVSSLSPEDQARYNKAKTALEAKNIIDKDGNFIQQTPDPEAVQSLKHNREVAAVTLDPIGSKAPVGSVEVKTPVRPVVETPHIVIDPTIPKPPPLPPRSTPRVAIEPVRVPVVEPKVRVVLLADGTSSLSDEDFKTAVDRLYQTIVQDRLDFSNVAVLLVNALKGN